MVDSHASHRASLRLGTHTRAWLTRHSLRQTPPVSPPTGSVWFDAIRDFGAIGDGEADDTAALNAAIQTAGAGNIPLVFPPGRYKVTRQLWVPSNVTCFAYGATILNFTVTSSEQGFLGVPLVVGSQEIGGQVRRVAIYGLEIDGRKEFQTEGKAGLRVQGDTRDLLVKDCYFHHNTGDGWFTLRVQGADSAVPVNCVFEDVVCTDNGRQGASITIGKHIVVRGGVYSNTSGAPPSAGIDVEPDVTGVLCEDIIIDGVSMTGNDGAGFLCDYALDGPSPVTNVHVRNCHIADNGFSGVTIRGGVGITISQCQILRSGNSGFELDMYPESPLVDLHVTGCRIYQNGSAGIFSVPVDTERFGQGWKFTDLSIINNGAAEPGRFHGIHLEANLDDILITGCTIQNRGTANQAYGLFTGGLISRLRVDLNNLSGNATGATALGDDESTRRYGDNNIE
jgi:hypothetical protein